MNLRDGLRQMQKYGGLRLMWEYCRMGLAWNISGDVVKCVVKGKPIKSVYYDTNRRVAPILLKKYEVVIQESIERYAKRELKQERTKIVWFCWLQGKEAMPEIVKACFNSQLQNIKDREFRFIDEQNWREYVQIPDDLVEKYRKGYMPAAMFSDLIRLELLIKYGGSWIDSTVLCTGGYNEQLLDADIFIYQYGHGKGLSNWFITSCTQNPMLMVIRDVLYAYWRDYNVVLDYFIFHLLFGRLMTEYPSMIARMPYADSYKAISLVHNWHKPYRKEIWDKVIGEIHFHKLAWKVSEKIKRDRTNYYNHIIETYNGR